MKALLLIVLSFTAQLVLSAEPSPSPAVEPAGPKILYEEDSTLLTSTIEIVVLTGSLDDPQGKTGLTSMMSEMLLRGTKSRNREQFQSEIERMGASFSVHAAYDKITFVGRVIKENTGKFFALINDALTHPKFDAKEIEALRTEQLADIAHLKNSNGRLAGLNLRRNLFAGTALERPVDGTLGTVKTITRDDLLRAYNQNITRGRFIFAMASPLKEADSRKAIEGIWTAFPDGPRPVRTSIAMKAPATPTIVLVEKPQTSTGTMMFGQPGITAQEPLRYTLGVGNFSFGGEALVSRLFKVVRGELGWTYAVGSTFHAAGSFTDQQGFYVISATPAIEYTTKAMLKVLAMWNEYLKSGLKSDELRLAEESLVNSYPFEFDSAEKRLSQKLHSYLYNVPLLSPEEYAKTIKDITNDKLKSALKERASEKGWFISLVADGNVIAKQLEEEQVDVPADQRLTISKRVAPEDLVN